MYSYEYIYVDVFLVAYISALNYDFKFDLHYVHLHFLVLDSCVRVLVLDY